MRFHRALDDLFSPPSRLKILRQMFGHPSKEFTGRELASLAGITHPAGNQALDALESTGIVRSRRAGASHLWRLTEEHTWTPHLRALFGAEERARDELITLLRQRLRSPTIRVAALYGSVARAEESPSSDVDLLLVVPTERAARSLQPSLARLQAEVARRFGNHLSPLVCTWKDWSEKAPNPALIEAIRKEGSFLKGTP